MKKYLSVAQERRKYAGILFILLSTTLLAGYYYYEVTLVPPPFISMMLFVGVVLFFQSLRYSDVKIRKTKIEISNFFSDWEFETYQIIDVEWYRPKLFGILQTGKRFVITLTFQDEKEVKFKFISAKSYDPFFFEKGVEKPSEARILREKMFAAHSRILEEKEANKAVVWNSEPLRSQNPTL